MIRATIFAGLFLIPAVLGCTTLLATPGSTVDGSSMAAHSSDGEGLADPRFVRIPAADYEDGAMREIYFAYENYPRYVGESRGVKDYFPTGNQTAYKPIGEIPQVPHTFAYFEEIYGVINEKQVGIAESTCSAIFGTKAKGFGGHAIMSVDTMTQLAMERATTAREAVELIGQMAEKYGFYGADEFEGTAESLMIVDPNEGWVFHVLPDPTGTSAIWAAQRVPDGHVTVVPNIFVIRDIDQTDPVNFLFSKNQFDIAEKRGLWKAGEAFDFTKIWSDGEYAHKYYSGRRLWRAFSLLAPEHTFAEDYTDLKFSSPYPFSVKPASKVSLHLVMAVMRDYLQGTKYDMASGVAAGPYGTPDRFNPGKGEKEVHGAWERPIALFRSCDSFVVQARSWLPDEVGGVVWFGPHGAHATCYVPFPIGMLELPKEYRTGDPRALSRKSAYWAHRYVENLANLRWRDMMRDVRAVWEKLEAQSLELVKEMDAGALAAVKEDGGDGGGGVSTQQRHLITAAFVRNAEQVVARWWRLPDELMEKYADGNVWGVPQGYPAPWLQAVGYPQGPPDVPPHAAGDDAEEADEGEGEGDAESSAQEGTEAPKKGQGMEDVPTILTGWVLSGVKGWW